MTPAMLPPSSHETPRYSDRLWSFCAVACGLTWVLAMPTATAWMRHEAPSPLAVTCAGLSAFGPLFAILTVATRAQRRDAFSRWRAPARWVVFSLLAAPAVHLVARALTVIFGGEPGPLLYPPQTPEMLAALVVFPLGEEFGWRGFAYPRFVERLGVVRGSLALGLVWGVWHLGYGVTPEAGAFDVGAFAVGLVELPLYSVLIAWVMERTGRSLLVAIAFHAGAHLDHIERAPDAGMLLRVCHVGVLVVLVTLAARDLARTSAASVAGQGPVSSRPAPPR